MSDREGFDEQASVLLIQALADVWKSIRDRHPAVPGVVLLAAPAQRGGLNVLGHFAALRWSARKKEGSALSRDRGPAKGPRPPPPPDVASPRSA